MVRGGSRRPRGQVRCSRLPVRNARPSADRPRPGHAHSQRSLTHPKTLVKDGEKAQKSEPEILRCLDRVGPYRGSAAFDGPPATLSFPPFLSCAAEFNEGRSPDETQSIFASWSSPVRSEYSRLPLPMARMSLPRITGACATLDPQTDMRGVSGDRRGQELVIGIVGQETGEDAQSGHGGAGPNPSPAAACLLLTAVQTRLTPARRKTCFRPLVRHCYRTEFSTRKVPMKGLRAASLHLVLLSQSWCNQHVKRRGEHAPPRRQSAPSSGGATWPGGLGIATAGPDGNQVDAADARAYPLRYANQSTAEKSQLPPRYVACERTLDPSHQPASPDTHPCTIPSFSRCTSCSPQAFGSFCPTSWVRSASCRCAMRNRRASNPRRRSCMPSVLRGRHIPIALWSAGGIPTWAGTGQPCSVNTRKMRRRPPTRRSRPAVCLNRLRPPIRHERSWDRH